MSNSVKNLRRLIRSLKAFSSGSEKQVFVQDTLGRTYEILRLVEGTRGVYLEVHPGKKRSI
ncbi:MAG: hypothetical protein UY48_C0038G0024 [Candidatus Gottesmanbacteria bacterium GW2011_GWB1_49_7]|uniref:Uncharacterized protein n=1 Tax=Candidatus Gottesmanbacteria bacterium GW2011_GWB1_49_7 TaxID=1618448 RepID=A0A0G1YVN5_9BACT|nr:MAG: hypothetical protein UY48_C0038G0024 [Candidatus Gottesmanbacteria bacterium GW2011_GWB1_49_7]